MKKILFVLFLIASLTQLSAQTKIDTSYDDSLSLAKAPIGSKFIVDVGDYEVYPDLNQIQQISLQESRKDTLAKGQSFRIVDTVRVFRKIAAKIELDNGSLAYIPNMRTIGKYCHKEGESAIHSKIWRTLDSGLRFTFMAFWKTLLVTFIISLLFLIFAGKIDNLLYKLSGREKKIKRPGFLFIVISAVIGALLGVTYLFNDMEFIEYAMYMPHFAFPTASSFLMKFYWFSQLLFIVMLCWLVYRSIKAFGPLYGILRSVVVLIAGVAIFWTTLATSFLAVIGILILTFTSTAALSAGDGPTEHTTIKEKTFTSSGEKENVIIKHDNSGHIKSKSNF